ncbi:MAG TPA: FGGY family carbohydrate kinase [Solirubrobacteraceae bacterium]
MGELTERAQAEVWVGLDLGTSGAKGIALGTDGTIVARAAADYPTQRPAPHASEQDPALWLHACTDVVARLRAVVEPAGWRGIALSAMIPTLVVLDERMRPLAPAVTWEDARAERHGERLRTAIGADWLYERTGQWVDGRYLLAMYERLAHDQPAVAARARHLVGAKDLLFAWLTGELLTDPSTAAGYGAYDVRADAWLAEPQDALEAELGAPVPQLPPVAPSHSTRPLSATAALILGLPAGLPICLGAADSVLGALGLGVDAPGDVAYIAGTSTVVLAIADGWNPDPRHRYLLTPLAGSPALGLEMDLLATGSAIRWLATLLADSGGEADLLALASELAPADAPAFLPYLAPGEQGALWNADLYGTVAGLHLGHGAAHLARGLLNGIMLESRRCLGVLADVGLPPGEIRAGGWCAAAPGVCRDLADCCRRSVRTTATETRDCSALGAARLLARALGDQIAEPGSAAGCAVAPDEKRARDWDALWERHEALRQATTPVYEQQEALCTGQ